jgi:AmmeMemoRadiSam system protein A
MFEPNTVYAKIAYDAILLYLKTGKKLFKKEQEIPPALKLNLACYVSIYSGHTLKSCVGDPQPGHPQLYNEIIENAVRAAFENPHSEPLKEGELNNISITVDVLSEPKPVKDASLIKPHKHGIIVKDTNGNQSLMLPNRDGIDTADKQLSEAKKNAGINPDTPIEELEVYNFTTTRYQ